MSVLGSDGLEDRLLDASTVKVNVVDGVIDTVRVSVTSMVRFSVSVMDDEKPTVIDVVGDSDDVLVVRRDPEAESDCVGSVLLSWTVGVPTVTDRVREASTVMLPEVDGVTDLVFAGLALGDPVTDATNVGDCDVMLLLFDVIREALLVTLADDGAELLAEKVCVADSDSKLELLVVRLRLAVTSSVTCFVLEDVSDWTETEDVMDCEALAVPEDVKDCETDDVVLMLRTLVWESVLVLIG